MDEMVGWLHGLNGQLSEKTPGDSDAQEGLSSEKKKWLSLLNFPYTQVL